MKISIFPENMRKSLIYETFISIALFIKDKSMSFLPPFSYAHNTNDKQIIPQKL